MTTTHPTPATVTITADSTLGPIRRIWAAIGYDELNWTYAPRGKAIYRTLGADVFTQGRYSVRMHNAFTSGNGLAGPAWGGGNPYHELQDGTPRYDWSILDQTYDTIVANGGIPLVELGFMPRDLSRTTSPDAVFGHGNDLGKEPYENGAWKQPPKDLDRWRDLVQAFVAHLVDRYGEAEVAHWRFELWNEPNIRHYWHGTVEDYLALWDASAAGARAAFPRARLGGPGTTDKGEAFLERFLQHLVQTGERPDFLSFHTKGAYYAPRRVYNPFRDIPPAGPSTPKMLDDITRNLDIIKRFPEFADIPVLIDECDPAVGTIYGVFDTPNFVVTNSEHYPSFVCNLVGALLAEPRIEAITHWAFYFEGKRWFEGNRTLFDNDNVEKPIVNGLRLLERLAGGEQLALESTHPSIRGIAVLQSAPARLLVLLWHHEDPWWISGDATVDLTLALPPGQSATGATLTRLDAAHANTFRVWESLGSPQDPTPEQIAQIHTAAHLHPEPATLTTAADQPNTLHLSLTLPLHGLAALEIPLSSAD